MQAQPVARPSPLLEKIARPTAAYRWRAWGALLGLAAFVAAYFALAAWFGMTALRLAGAVATGRQDGLLAVVGAAGSAFLAVFMLKALFFSKRGSTGNPFEVTAAQQPELFKFLHELADRAGAPRPHRVFLSAGVNAAVFYDLSLLNLVIPSRKNLEIGLGLVNALSLGELRAVLAHEFGHFAQRAMAVGRWVYVAQQIAAHLVARRDKLDQFLHQVSRVDFRIAWIGWCLGVVVWSIRSLVDSAFQGVVLMQRALSREMEMNADLVAVSLTGSDALVHALHKLQAADDAWARALGFAASERSRGRRVSDLFSVQSEIVTQMGRLLNDPHHGSVPPMDATCEPAQHRLFRAELAQPPQMWLTHPLNHEREANAKRRYVSARIDGRSAWAVFAQPEALRREVTGRLLGPEPSAVDDDASQQALRAQFEREALHSRYRGIYFGRSAVRAAARTAQLYEPVAGVPTAQELAALYPESLREDMEQLRTLEKEVHQLRALKEGTLKAPDGQIHHRGKNVRRSQLAALVDRLERQLAEVTQRLQAHDRKCRSLHLALASQWERGWPEYLRGLLSLVHYAEHTEADLRDLQGVLATTVHFAVATRHVGEKDMQRVLLAANHVTEALQAVYKNADAVQLDAALLQGLGVESWKACLGTLGLPYADRNNIKDWLDAVQGWIDHVANRCVGLRLHALEALLKAEAMLAGGQPPEGEAPPASTVPSGFPTLVPGSERERQRRLHWWARFQVADGLVAALARVAVAGGIVAGVVAAGMAVQSASVTVYNGLAVPVTVVVGNETVRVPPGGFQGVSAEAGSLRLQARTASGVLIEQFTADAGDGGRFVYNVAGAAPLVEWTAAYGSASVRPPRKLGAPRWTATHATTLFSRPPSQLRSKSGGGTVEVLSGLANEGVSVQLGRLDSERDRQQLVMAHARYDALDSRRLAEWLSAARAWPEHRALLAERLEASPHSVVLLRAQQDGAPEGEHAAVCARHAALAAGHPDDADLQYVAARCLPAGPQQDQAFIDGLRRFPSHGWFAFAAGHAEARRQQWSRALTAYGVMLRGAPVVAEIGAIDMARVLRMLGHREAEVTALAARSDLLDEALAGERDATASDLPEADIYPALRRGDLDRAVRLATAMSKPHWRMVRLAAASRGASRALVERGLALALDQGIDVDSVWSSAALALREGRDISPWRPVMRKSCGDESDRMLAFAQALAGGRPAPEAELFLGEVSAYARGHAYAMGIVLLGDKAPGAWRDAAGRLLFTAERPFLD